MARIPEDPTIYVGMRLYDGSDYDTVIERVEYGGFGVIAFGPNRLRDNRMTAYKTLRRELLDDPQMRMAIIRDWALSWMGLWGHANVANVLSVMEMGDSLGSRPFLALDFAEHGSLRHLLRAVAEREPNHRLPLDLALNLAQQIAAGLAYLHRPEREYLRSEPIVHHDLKPEHILLMGDGRAVITDFGLTKIVDSSPVALALLQGLQHGYRAEGASSLAADEATRTTSIRTTNLAAAGTPAYMAPERWNDGLHAGTPTDIYALGIMLSEIVAGRHALLDLDQPHTLDDWRRAHLELEPRPLREDAPDIDIPDALEIIYQRCLARDPDARPTTDEVLTALRECAQSSGLEAYSPAEFIPHTPFNEFIHWHQWAIAYENFSLYGEALTCNDQALRIARQIATEHPDLLPTALVTRGKILAELGVEALSRSDHAMVEEWDRQADATFEAFEESLTTPGASKPESRGRYVAVLNMVGVFNSGRSRFDKAEVAYARALNLQPDMAHVYYNRALNQARWGIAEAEAGQRGSAGEHLRQARLFAITSHALGDSTAKRLLDNIEEALRHYGVTD